MQELWKKILCRKNEHKNSVGAARTGSAYAYFVLWDTPDVVLREKMHQSRMTAALMIRPTPVALVLIM